ncbi:hypothetical protein JCM11641_006585 [Rhodosporidiobolus odoratus]
MNMSLRQAVTRLSRCSPTLTRTSTLQVNNYTSQLAATHAKANSSSAPLRNNVSSLANAFLHGSPEAKQESQVQHSKLKFIHEFQSTLHFHTIVSQHRSESALAPVRGSHPSFLYLPPAEHKVLPHQVEEYKSRIESYYKGIHESSEFDARLTGSWEIVVGEVDTFVHVWEYEGLPGFEKTKTAIRESKGHLQFFNHEILPLIQSRTSQLNREFRFWETSPAAEKGGIYELRTYQLQPGALLEWENEWRVGLEARLNSGHYPVGAWFSQIGPLHQVHHMWNYPSLEARGERRAESWKQDAWSGTVSKTTRLTSSMTTNILKPLPFSPLR